MNRKDATIAGILALGYTEQVGRSRKYRCFEASAETHSTIQTLLVGKAGALRVIASGNAIAVSTSCTGMKRHRALEFVGRTVATQDLSPETCYDLYKGVLLNEINPADHFKEMK